MKPRFAPFWYDRFPASRRVSFPRLRSEIDTRVAVVGGGLTGIACAAALAAARVPVVVLDAGRVGAQATAASVGLIREDFDVPFQSIVEVHGLRAARTMWQPMRRAARELAATLRRLGIDAGLVGADLLSLTSADKTSIRLARREYDARRGAGIDGRWLAASAVRREAAVEAAGALRTSAAALDPYRAALGLAIAAAKRGALVFESSAVRRIKTSSKGVEVRTADGIVRAELVVVATGAPLPDLRQLRRHLIPRESYAVVTERLPAAVRRQLGLRQATLRDGADPPHLVRWLADDRVMVSGGDQPPPPSRAHQQTLVQRTGQLMYELSLLYPAISGVQPEYSAPCPYEGTTDGLPYFGLHRNFPRHFFALGSARHGAGAAWLAARILARHVAGAPDKGDDLFGFSRILG